MRACQGHRPADDSTPPTILSEGAVFCFSLFVSREFEIVLIPQSINNDVFINLA